MGKIAGYALTLLVAAAAVFAAAAMYSDYLTNPWTRDGQVRATVIQVAPRVSGPIVKLPIRDNQIVQAGDLLFEIDRRTYEAELARAEAEYDTTKDNIAALAQQVIAAEASVDQYKSAIEQAQAQVDSTTATLEEAAMNLARAETLLEQGNVAQMRVDTAQRNYSVDLAANEQAKSALESSRSALVQAEANLAKARADLGEPGEENAQLRAAKAAMEEARLNLEFTRVVASVEGQVTNLELQLGSQVVANQPALALVDLNSFWVEAYFRETMTADMAAGQEAVVTLMSNPRSPFLGTVDSLSRGIAMQNGSAGSDLLPNVSPTFEWIRLAQRIPVRVELGDVPENVTLRVGSTASVMVRTKGATGEMSPAPSFLQ
jgi:multidrug resistance efflux pump